MTNAIRFVKGWMGRPVGSIDRGNLGYGQMLALVTHGFAEWATEPEQQSPRVQQRTKRFAKQEKFQ